MRILKPMKIYKTDAADPFAKCVKSNRTTRKVHGVRCRQDACLISFKGLQWFAMAFNKPPTVLSSICEAETFFKEVQHICNVFNNFNDFPMPLGANNHLLWYIQNVSPQMGNQFVYSTHDNKQSRNLWFSKMKSKHPGNPKRQKYVPMGKTMFLKHEATYCDEPRRLQIHVFGLLLHDKFTHVSTNLIFAMDIADILQQCFRAIRQFTNSTHILFENESICHCKTQPVWNTVLESHCFGHGKFTHA